MISGNDLMISCTVLVKSWELCRTPGRFREPTMGWRASHEGDRDDDHRQRRHHPMDDRDDLTDYAYTGDDHDDDFCQRYDVVDDDHEHNHDNGRKVLRNIRKEINRTSDFSSGDTFAFQPLVMIWPSKLKERSTSDDELGQNAKDSRPRLECLMQSRVYHIARSPLGKFW